MHDLFREIGDDVKSDKSVLLIITIYQLGIQLLQRLALNNSAAQS
jgi:hypothetical protein